MIQLVAYKCSEEGGGRLGALPTPRSFTATAPLNEVGSLTFTYPRQGINVDWLVDKYFEVAVEMDLEQTGTYNEPLNLRYISTGRQDEGTESAGDYTFTLAGYAWNLNAALVWGLSSLNADGKREFTSANAGKIMKTLLDENKSLGWCPQFDYTFSDTVDSAGAPWNLVLPKIEYEPTLSLFTVLDNLSKQGLCDWVMDGRELKLFRIDQNLGRDRSDSVILHYGADLLEGPNRIENTNLRHRVLVQGEGKARALVDQVSGVAAPWGKWFAAVDQGGISDTGTMQAYAARALEGAKLPTAQLTRTMALPVRKAGAAPFTDFRSGDYITAPNASGVREKLRVRDMGLNFNGGAYTTILTLNDRILEQELRLSRRVTGIVGGTTRAGGSGGIPSGQDKRMPKAPTGLGLGSDTYLDSGQTRGRVLVTWTAVSQATNNTAMDISEYEVWARRSGQTSSLLTTTNTNSVTTSNYMPNDTWYFKVRAKGSNGIFSAFSAESSIVIARDETPPGRPSTPTVESSFGTLRVTWDGKEEGGSPQPADYGNTVLHVSATSGFTPSASTAYDGFTGPGVVYIGGVPYGQTRYIKLVSQDRSGNASTPSVEVACTQEEAIGDINIGGQSIRVGSIDYSKLRMGQGNLIVDPTFSNATMNGYRAAHSPANIAFAAPSTTYPNGAATVTNATTLYFGVSSDSMQSDWPMEIKPGAKYSIQLYVERLSGTGQHGLYIDWISSSGTLNSALPAVGTATQDVNVVWTAPATAVKAVMRFRNLVTGIVSRVSRPVFAEQVSGTLIQDDAISTPKILAGAVIAEHLAANSVTANAIAANSISAGKISAGSVNSTHLTSAAIDGKVITGASIRSAPPGVARVFMAPEGFFQQTASGTNVSSWTPTSFQFRSATSGARIDISSSVGIRVFDSSGKQTFFADSSDGSLDIAGTFRTNPSTVFPRTELTNASHPGGMFGMTFYSSSGQSAYPYVRSTYQTVGDWVSNSLVLGSGSGLTRTRITLGANGFVHVGNDAQTTGMTISGTALYIKNNNIYLDGYTYINDMFTTTSSANMNRLGSILREVTSLSRFKLEQEPLGIHYEVLDLEAKTWVDRAAREADPDYNERFVGVIAEEAEALSAANGGSLDPLLDRNEEGELRGFNYDRLAAVLIPVVRDMREQQLADQQLIADLTNRLAALEAAS